MRRALSSLLTLAVCATAAVLPATAARAIDPPRVRVTPGVSSVLVGATRQLSATVTGLESTAVTWSVRSGPGAVDATGLYTPPATPPPSPLAVVRAASAEDPGIYGEATVSIGAGVAGGAFAAPAAATSGAAEVRAGDVNGDGVADVVRLVGEQSFHFVTMVWNGTGFTESVSPGSSVYQDGFTRTADWVGDFGMTDVDRDGDVDLVVVFESNSAQTFREQVYFNNGTGSWTKGPLVRADQGGARSGGTLRITDFDGDGHVDLVRLDPFGVVVLQRGDGTGAFGASVPLMSVSAGEFLDVGDLTGDGRPEVVVGRRTGTYTVERTFDVAINDGFGNIAGTSTYEAGLNPEPTVYDVDGDGWNDLVVGIGSDGATFEHPKVMAHRNLATGAGTLSASGVQLFSFRPSALTPAHVDADGVLDLAGATFRGPFHARRTGPSTFSALHASTTFATARAAVADVTGDGVVDVLPATDSESRLFPGAADATPSFAIDPTVSYVNATMSALFTASARNTPAPVEVQFSASRGTWSNEFFLASSRTYTAPATASSAGTPVRVTASLAGLPSSTRDILVVNDRYQAFGLGGQQVRQLVRDPAAPQTLYAATASGVHRSTNNGASFTGLGSTGTTGMDARQLAVVRDSATGTARLVAQFASSLYRLDLNGGDWVALGLTGAASVSSVPDSLVVFAVAGGQVLRSTDGGLSFNGLGGTQVQEVEAVSAGSLWVRRATAPRVHVGTIEAGVLTLTARDLPAGAATSVTVRPAERNVAYVTTSDSPYRVYRGDATTGTWTQLATPGWIDQVSVSPTGELLATRYGTPALYKSRDDGASWYSAYRGFPNNAVVNAVAHRSDGLDLVGTGSGMYVPVSPTPPPAPSVTDGPAAVTGPGGANAFSFAFTGTGASYLCALDDKDWAACTSPKSYGGPLTSGSHTFSVVAVDATGNESAAATRTWEVDATPPGPVTDLTGPAALTNQTVAAFTWTLPEGAAGATCSLDDAAPTACASGVEKTVAQGAHTFAVRAVDEHGNAATAVTKSWTVDTTPPAYPHFFQRPQPTTSSSSAFFSWSSDGSATYACQLDGQPVACSPSSYGVSGLSHGVHSFQVLATDAAGNVNANGMSWNVDLVDPEAPVISAGPAAVTTATTAEFTFESASSDVSSYRCALNGAFPTACYGTKSYTGLPAQAHQFTVYAVDYAQRQSAVATYAWTITADPPPASPTLTGGPTGLVGSRTAAFTYSIGEGLTARCAVDGATPTACPATGTTYENVAEGAHTFAVYAVSPGGLVSEPATRSWTVDVTPPAAPTLLAAPPVRTASDTAAFDWTPADGVTYACSLDGVSVACGADGSYAIGDLAESTHLFAVRAGDAAGNWAEKSHTWTVDRTGPVAVLTAKPAALTKSTTAAFAYSAEAADLDGFTCTLDGVDHDCDGTSTDVSSLAEGAHTFSVVALDDLGNAGAPATHTWTVDTTAPQVTIAAGGASLTAGRPVTFSEPVKGVSASTVRLLTSAGAVPGTVACRNLANATVACSAADVRGAVVTPASPLVPGQVYVVEVNGLTDHAGNAAPLKSSASFNVSTSEQESSVAAKPSWRKAAWTGAQGGSYTVAHLKGETATYAFTGTGITWYAVRGPSYGTADVYVDDVKKGTFNFWSTSVGTTYKTIGGLSSAKHTLKIVVRGEKGSTKGTGTDVAVDAFKAGGVSAATPAVTYGWARTLAKPASGGAYALEDYAGATYSFTFRGRGIDWVTVYGPGMGKATVHIDGVSKGTFDNWASATAYGKTRRFTGLTDKVHTITITVLRQRRSGATGYGVAVDRFGVLR